jgi:hypothetical protein
MMLRYWGAGEEQPADIASVVEGARKGISTGQLSEA